MRMTDDQFQTICLIISEWGGMNVSYSFEEDILICKLIVKLDDKNMEYVIDLDGKVLK